MKLFLAAALLTISVAAHAETPPLTAEETEAATIAALLEKALKDEDFAVVQSCDGDECSITLTQTAPPRKE